MSMKNGELAVKVDGRLVYSYSGENHKLPSDEELLRRVTAQ